MFSSIPESAPATAARQANSPRFVVATQPADRGALVGAGNLRHAEAIAAR